MPKILISVLKVHHIFYCLILLIDKSKSKASAQKSRNQYFPQGYSENTKLSLQSNTIQSTPQSSLTPVTPIVNDSKSISPYQNFDFGKRKDTDESLKSNYGSYSLNNGQYNQDRSNTSILNKTNGRVLQFLSHIRYLYER